MLTFLKIAISVAIAAWWLFTSLGWDQRTDMPAVRRKIRLLVVGPILLVLSLFVLFPGIGTVPEGSRGIVLRFGAATGRVIDPGLYIVNPFTDSVVETSVQIQAETREAEGASKDLQVVHTEITANFEQDPASVVQVYRTLRGDAVGRVIRPAMDEAVKAATAEFKAEELIQHRQDVKGRIEAILRTRIEAHGYRLDAISITDFDFSEEFNRAIESKVTATQSALKAENDLVRVRMEAQQAVEKAKAEAEGLRQQRDAITPELLLLRAIEKWDGKLPTTFAGSMPVPMLQVGK